MNAAIAPGIRPNEAQRVRDACDLRTACAACGNLPDEADPLVLAEGALVHLHHVRNESDGFYGAVFQAVTA